MEPESLVQARARRLVVVLGMHRSGTSALARGLQVIGVDLGDNLLPGVPGNNDKGFFEDIDVFGLNDRILAAAGVKWDQVGMSSLERIDPSVLRQFESGAAQILARRARTSGYSGIKDPRFCRMLPFWQPVFAAQSLQVSYVLALRNPLSVAQSLARRDGMSLEKALCLWTVHMVSALQRTQHERLLVVDFDSLIEAPAVQLRRIAGFLHIPDSSIDADQLREFGTEFLDQELLHCHAGDPELASDPRVPDLTREIFALLRSLSRAEADDAGARPSPGALDLMGLRTEEMCTGFSLGALEAARGTAEVSPPRTRSGIESAFTVYYADGTQGFIEARTSRATIVIGGGIQRVSLEIPGGSKRVRIDPAQHPCIVRFRKAAFCGPAGQLLDDAPVSEARLSALSGVFVVNTQGVPGSVELLCIGDDPQFILELAGPVQAAVEHASVQFNAELDVRLLAEEVPLGIDDMIAMAESQCRDLAAIFSGISEQKDLRLSDLSAQIALADRSFREAREEIAELHASHRLSLSEQDAGHRSALAEQDAGHRRALAEQDAGHRRVLSELDAGHRRSLAEMHDRHASEVSGLVAARAELQERVRGLEQSTSWRITAPMRFATTRLRGVLQVGYRKVAAGVRFVYHRVPVGMALKLRIKSALFICLPVAFKRTRAYADWERHTGRVPREPEYTPALEPSPGDRAQRVTAAGRDRSYVGEARLAPDAQPAVTAVAFYLPQFHPCRENDEWWGAGFTEWTNVSRALPQFNGHYQPHLPGELGFYDLRVPEVMERQVALARSYGLGAFCFYFYWFHGTTLLEMPVRRYLERAELDLPFCLCWANENWSRRWDGRDSDLLISQSHSAADDYAFFDHVAVYLRDPRYLKIEGRPVLLVYRPELLPDPVATAARWRERAAESGLPDPYLVYPQSFRRDDPAVYGFDAAVEFPPNLSDVPIVTAEVARDNPEFDGTIYDWSVLVARSEHYDDPQYTLFRGVCPSWDNEARRPGRGTVFANSNPANFQRWMRNAVQDTCARFTRPDHRLVFINAWNEWAEGAHLEPDARYGYAWLEAMHNALTGSIAPARRIVVVTHDAYPHGAQFLALNLVREFAQAFGFDVATVCLGDGPLKPEFAKHGVFHDLAGIDPRGEDALRIAMRLRDEGYEAAIVNSTVSGAFIEALARAGMRTVALVHELPGVLHQYKLELQARAIGEFADAVVFPADVVRDAFVSFAGCDAAKCIVRPQGLYKRNRLARTQRMQARKALRSELGLPDDAFVVLGVGYADARKGIDLFVEAGLQAAARDAALHFVWVGHWDAELEPGILARLRRHPGVESRFHFTGLRQDTDHYYAGADLFALTSREDPFPTVVLEALDAGLPVAAFAGGGGYEQLVRDASGIVVPMEDTAALAEAYCRAAGQPGSLEDARARGPALLFERYSFRKYLFDLLDMAGIPHRRVTAIVPNYNYARYLEARLESVCSQGYPVFELIVLDDASADDSVAVVEQWAARTGRDLLLDINSVNSGNVFGQWARGVALATGDYVWIAEADDLSSADFLTGVLKAFDDPEVVLSYCESRQMAADGTILCNDYRDYVADISPSRWQHSYVRSGMEEIREALCIKNTIPNASAVVFRRDCLRSALESESSRLRTLKVAGDWLVYLRVLERGAIAYSSVADNSHRRHADSVTLSGFDLRQLREIVSLQDLAARRFDLPVGARAAAQAYAQRLYEQFGLADAGRTDYRDAVGALAGNAADDVVARAEQSATAGRLNEVLQVLRELSLREFGELLLAMPDARHPALASVLPGMASEQVQQSWTGSSGKVLLRQSHAFVDALWRRFEHLGVARLDQACVLDYGCGYGRLLRLMLYFCDPERLFGCDPWDQSIRLCSEHRIPANLAVSDYLPESLPFAPGSMDLAYAFSVFTHTSLRATVTALAALRKALKPGGILLITIRPVSYWHADASIDAAVRAELIRDHELAGFAFLPHKRQEVDGDVTYGDTSISLERLAEIAAGWTILESGIQEIDPYQRMVFLRRDGEDAPG